MKVYIVWYSADWGEDGHTSSPVGVYSAREKALEPIQQYHKQHDLTPWGLNDWRVYELELDELPSEPWYQSADYTELSITFDNPDKYNNKVVYIQ